jgi:DMSO/TMAO reductase YedYZ heme-binding membrane subunit
VHLAALTTFLTITNQPPQTTTLVGGGAAYALLYAMALTSTDAAKRAMGRWWKALHKTGIHWLWFVFASSYAGRLSDPDRWVIGAVFTPIAFAAAAIRFAAWIKVRRMHAARAVPA